MKSPAMRRIKKLLVCPEWPRNPWRGYGGRGSSPPTVDIRKGHRRRKSGVLPPSPGCRCRPVLAQGSAVVLGFHCSPNAASICDLSQNPCERDGIPAALILPRAFDLEAGIAEKNADRRVCELVAVLSMNAFALYKTKFKVCRRDAYNLVACTLQMHF